MNEGPLHNLVPPAQERKMFWVLCLTSVIMLVETAGGYLSGSLALLADASHMLADVAALLLSWLAMRLGRRPPDKDRSFGSQRLQILAAYTNGLFLIAITGIIAVEAWDRLHKPEVIDTRWMLGVAVIGFFTNLASYFVLRDKHPHAHDHNHSHDHAHGSNLNLHSALIHVLSDLAGTFGTILAALVIMFTGWHGADPVLSVLICLLIFTYAWNLIKRTVHILIQGTPDPTLSERIQATLLQTIPGILDVHHIHLWSLTETQTIVTLDVTIAAAADSQTILTAIQRTLAEQYQLDHITVQIEQQRTVDSRQITDD